MKTYILVLLLFSCGWARANETILREVREYIKIYEQHYPRTELYFDILKLQSSSPKEKLKLASDNTNELNTIYDDYELQTWAQRIAIKMDPSGPFNDQYKSTLSGLMKIYLNEPAHRRAIQSLFDVISITYFSKADKKHHYDRMNYWQKHLLDYAEWTWGIAALWSLRTNPSVMNSTKWYIKPLSSALKRIPLPKFYTQVYKSKLETPIYEMHFFRRLGHHLNSNRYIKPIIDSSKDAAIFSGVTFGTAATLGIPSFLIYPYLPHKMDPSPKYLDAQYKNSDNIGVKLHQMAILELGCRSLNLATDIESIDLKPNNFERNLEIGKLIKTEVNDLVDSRRYLYEISYFFSTSNELHPDILWNADKAQFTLEDKNLDCKILKNRTRKEIENNLINLNDINRQLNSNIVSFEKKYNEFLFNYMDQKVESLSLISLEMVKIKDSQFYNLQKKMLNVKNEEELSESIKTVLTAIAYIVQNKINLFELSDSQIEEINVDTEDAANLVHTLKAYLKRVIFIQNIYQLSDDSQNILEQTAKDIVYEWPSHIFNAYIVHLITDNYSKESQKRKTMIFLISAISERLKMESVKNIIPDINKYIDPMLFLSSFYHDFINEIKIEPKE